MPPSPAEPTLAHSRLRRVALRVFALEIITLIALWLIGRTFGT